MLKCSASWKIAVLVHIREAADFLQAERSAHVEKALVDHLRVLDTAVDFVGERARHARAEHAHRRALDLCGAGVHELEVVQVCPTGLLDDLQRTGAAQLEHEVLFAEITRLDIERAAHLLVEEVRVDQVEAQEVLVSGADDDAVGENLASLIAENGVAGLPHRERAEGVDGRELEHLEVVGTMDLEDVKGVERAVQRTRVVVRHLLNVPAVERERVQLPSPIGVGHPRAFGADERLVAGDQIGDKRGELDGRGDVHGEASF